MKSLTHHRQALRHSFDTLLQKPMSSILTLIVITAALTLSVSFWIFTNNIAAWASGWQKSSHISLFLNTRASGADIESLVAQVKSTEGVEDAEVTLPDDALKELSSQQGMEDVMSYLTENPLPAVIDVTPAMEVDNPSALEDLYNKLRDYPHVEQAKLDMDWVSKVYSAIQSITTIAHVISLALALVVILIIGNTLRLTIHQRFAEIQVLKLIGASDAYIMRPFLYLGMSFGLCAAILAIILVDGCITLVDEWFQQLFVAFQMHFTWSYLSISETLAWIGFAMLLGWLGAYFSVKRSLRV